MAKGSPGSILTMMVRNGMRLGSGAGMERRNGRPRGLLDMVRAQRAEGSISAPFDPLHGDGSLGVPCLPRRIHVFRDAAERVALDELGEAPAVE
jgi:hypothetical protein